ncbi:MULTISPECIES: MFS transporter [unclassified Streptomyces]|uniref:MFS transporter n=1 Tax=unclassified Streptomyces TaxID=2593676 RepID=UPI002E2DBFE1|nr:MFS transporter [Streptomyces sp. NBC_01439]
MTPTSTISARDGQRTVAPDPGASPLRAWLAVIALGLGTFSFVTTETLPIGLLPSIGAGLDVSVGTAGFLVTGFAAVAAITAAPLTTLCGRIDRKWLLAGLLVLYVAGNLLAVIANSYGVLLGARVLVALAHGVFWSIAAAIAVRLVPERHAVRATALVLGGISLASVLGVPLGTMIGQRSGWHTAFAAVAAIGFVVLVAVLFLLPSLPAQGVGSLAALPRVLRNSRLRAAVGVTALVMIGHFLAFTYIAPYLEQVTGISEGMVGVLLLVFGAAGFAGNFVAGAVVGRSVHGTLVGALVLMAGSLALLWAFGDSRPAAITLLVLWGLAFAALPVGLQTWVLQLAKEESDAASSLYVAAFNGAIAVGSLAGGLVVDSAAGPRAVTAVAAVLTACALLTLVLSARTERTRTPAPGSSLTNA